MEIGPLAEWLPSHITTIESFVAERYPHLIEQKTDLAYAEVLEYNKSNEERERANDRSSREHQINRQRKHSYLDR